MTGPALREIRNHLKKEKPLKDAKFLSRYVGSVGHEDRSYDEQSRLKFLGYSMPQVNAFAKYDYSFTSLDPQDQLRIWLDLYHGSDTHDELSIALSWMSRPKNMPLLLKNPRELFRLQNRVDNWATSDSVSDLVAAYSEVNPAAHLKQLQKWNRSKNPWERRQSLVGAYCYARKRKKPIAASKVFPLIENLIGDSHFFVQKAVGWALREVEQVDPQGQRKFLRQHLYDLSSAAYTTATEKFPVAEKSKLKALRKEKRRR
ncbi:MAG: DNA alkylation repair protein [Bdellovibrionaceae bacterium]|nr:DNA alkylation repair protein [Pseudobdellovibrionaceae bacterium]